MQVEVITEVLELGISILLLKLPVRVVVLRGTNFVLTEAHRSGLDPATKRLRPLSRDFCFFFHVFDTTLWLGQVVVQEEKDRKHGPNGQQGHVLEHLCALHLDDGEARDGPGKEAQDDDNGHPSLHALSGSNPLLVQQLDHHIRQYEDVGVCSCGHRRQSPRHTSRGQDPKHRGVGDHRQRVECVPNMQPFGLHAHLDQKHQAASWNGQGTGPAVREPQLCELVSHHAEEERADHNDVVEAREPRGDLLRTRILKRSHLLTHVDDVRRHRRGEDAPPRHRDHVGIAGDKRETEGNQSMLPRTAAVRRHRC
mmetsp:Transcript_1909/g.4877  ORF Transcript_1909/g.4877 Transcript_1909/m.4877 type:complete len:310 (+) Transcript_1909:697-1626(+)